MCITPCLPFPHRDPWGSMQQVLYSYCPEQHWHHSVKSLPPVSPACRSYLGKPPPALLQERSRLRSFVARGVARWWFHPIGVGVGIFSLCFLFSFSFPVSISWRLLFFFGVQKNTISSFCYKPCNDIRGDGVWIPH